jgi:hypothetical protein
MLLTLYVTRLRYTAAYFLLSKRYALALSVWQQERLGLAVLWETYSHSFARLFGREPYQALTA